CAGLAVIVGIPLAQPFARLGQPTAWAWTTEDLQRIGHLAANTLFLAGSTCVLAVPAGTLLAVMLFRTNLPARHIFTALLLLSLFVPLPVIVSSWQGLLGSGGLLPL